MNNKLPDNVHHALVCVTYELTKLGWRLYSNQKLDLRAGYVSLSFKQPIVAQEPLYPDVHCGVTIQAEASYDPREDLYIVAGLIEYTLTMNDIPDDERDTICVLFKITPHGRMTKQQAAGHATYINNMVSDNTETYAREYVTDNLEEYQEIQSMRKDPDFDPER